MVLLPTQANNNECIRIAAFAHAFYCIFALWSLQKAVGVFFLYCQASVPYLLLRTLSNRVLINILISFISAFISSNAGGFYVGVPLIYATAPFWFKL